MWRHAFRRSPPLPRYSYYLEIGRLQQRPLWASRAALSNGKGCGVHAMKFDHSATTRGLYEWVLVEVPPRRRTAPLLFPIPPRCHTSTCHAIKTGHPVQLVPQTGPGCLSLPDGATTSLRAPSRDVRRSFHLH